MYWFSNFKQNFPALSSLAWFTSGLCQVFRLSSLAQFGNSFFLCLMEQCSCHLAHHLLCLLIVLGDCLVSYPLSKLLANGTCQIAPCKFLFLIFVRGTLRLSCKSLPKAHKYFFNSLTLLSFSLSLCAGV